MQHPSGPEHGSAPPERPGAHPPAAPVGAPRRVTPPAPDALVQAVAAARSRAWRGAERERFQEALCAYVDDLRASGLDAVQTILAVKRAASTVPPSLLDESVTWCIKRYYGAS